MSQASTISGDDEADSTDIAGSIADDRAPTEAGILDAISVVAFVGDLPQELRLVAEAALEADGELAEAQRATGLSTSEFYRRMREIRYRMVMIGLVDRGALRPLGKKPQARGYLQNNEADEGANDLLGKTSESPFPYRGAMPKTRNAGTLFSFGPTARHLSRGCGSG